jgi:hypothetical protein
VTPSNISTTLTAIAAAVSIISPLIPGAILTIENLFGHSSISGSQDGPEKMAAAIKLLTTALQALSDAGKVPPVPVADPALSAVLAGAIQQAVDSLKAQGQLGNPTTAPSPVVVVKVVTDTVK